ncbi:hypothetical protein [Roseiconus lacunae]|uniref:hypothetical protein n=1 Tax=Roseiconus lacunae TaxID=2605694 RepID=UPI001E643C76|nr:hypothetical protein [Roseiconus lacunae]MCD0459983.1 hypothetical protein [Roseiconus lacunae]
MDTPPERTGLSGLSESELLLCDFLWEHTVMTRCLEDDVYPLHMNVGYSHGLTRQQLVATLTAMVERDLATVDGNLTDSNSSVTLTETGGSQWEMERNPLWDCFISQRGNIADNRMTVVAPDERLGRHYIGARIAADIEIQSGPIRVRRSVNLRLLPWRLFDGLTVLRFACYPTSLRYAHWDIYNERRIWWSTLAELKELIEIRG